MRKIKLIKCWSDVEYKDKRLGYLVNTYNVSTFTRSEAIGNLVDLIHDIDLLINIGYSEYLQYLKNELTRCEDILLDTMHARNLFAYEESDLHRLNEDERKAYVFRSDLKIEIQFVETNQTFINNIIKALDKINKFTSVKNERIYTPRILKYVEKIIEKEER